MGFFITFEGIEGCGKTTQIKKEGEYLSSKHIPFIITEEPGGVPLGLAIRKILLDESSFAICAESELFLFLAARAQHVRDIIIPTLEKNKVVLCDRFSDATIAYQSFGRGLDINFIQKINEVSTGGLKPDLTLLFDTPVEVGLQRAIRRISRSEGLSREDRFEKEEIKFHDKVREGYLSLARNEPERFRIIDGTKSKDEVHREVCFHISTLIDSRG